MPLAAADLAFFCRPTPPTDIYTLSLHDALPIYRANPTNRCFFCKTELWRRLLPEARAQPPPQLRLDRKSTRLNSSHVKISYAVFCLKKKTTSTKYRTAA